MERHALVLLPLDLLGTIPAQSTIMLASLSFRRPFSKLSEREILALAIGAEEEDSRIYAMYAEILRQQYPQSAAVFDGMKEEEVSHRDRLMERYRHRFGEVIPVVKREDVSGFYRRRPVWLVANLSLDQIRSEAALMERQAGKFYLRAAELSTDLDTKKLLGDLAAAELGHEKAAEKLERTHLGAEAREQEDKVAQLEFILTYVQPGLAGLMDGSVSTLAPVFAAAFATHNSWDTFLVGFAASAGAGISMGLTEALADDGALSGRGSPLKRGLVCGMMTMVGGLGHALPYVVPHFWTATILASIIVLIELFAIAWIQNKYMKVPFFRAALQIVVGGGLVFAIGILVGSA